jgi:hypothetical protein
MFIPRSAHDYMTCAQGRDGFAERLALLIAIVWTATRIGQSGLETDEINLAPKGRGLALTPRPEISKKAEFARFRFN